MCEKLLFRLFSRSFWRRALPPAAIILGMTLLLSQANAQQLNSSKEHLKTWEELSRKFDQSLDQHEQTLIELSTKLLTSERSGGRLTDLYNELLKQNAGLKNYNVQIAERMQERDEDLAQAYDRIDKLEKRRLKTLLAIIIMGALIAGYAAIKILRVIRL